MCSGVQRFHDCGFVHVLHAFFTILLLPKNLGVLMKLSFLCRRAAPPVAPCPAPLPSPMRTNFINRTPVTSTLAKARSCFRHNVSITDISHRDISFTSLAYRPQTSFNGAELPADMKTRQEEARFRASNVIADAAKVTTAEEEDAARSFGERVEEKTVSWRQKRFGKVTFGPRNYPYPISKWLGRRFQMKKHRILKRYRFRRYKLAAVANLPFAKMIRVGMLPELKSSKAKKGDDVESGLGTLLVNAAKSSTGGKQSGRRSRPKSKYQV